MNRRRPGRSRVAVAAALVSGVALSGCGGGVESLSFPAPPSTSPQPPTTAVAPPADYSQVRQSPVPGVTTTTLPTIGPGAATIDGTIVGPSGPVAGATVEAERIVDGVSAATQATTAADGSFTISKVLGGVYRLRAWQPPMLSLITPDVFFLGATDTQSVTFTLQSFGGVQVTSSMAPGTVEVGDDANLVVSVTQQTVGPDGVVRPVPMPAQNVTLDDGGGWSTLGANPAVTGPDGNARFVLTCTSAPAPAVIASVAGAAPATLPTSTCVNPAPPVTTPPAATPPDGGSGGVAPTTSTTIAAAPPST
ncbi:carboxypeptidase-like regulatory domain-containing protein [Acidiferrimicrobium sp. IK]|uniref:carboxypeptidase-like regulatory domain-containing protein n=1 Tax=Acidiferrimicrobium sp. IK TaxID=2871700 RepID=UPI0021CB4386|nr:carboxypeptidase-like regulatory domain-containing protein [Acidiferrimicrobium sp. IK]MCU4183620.1 carboxypeptidase-like regulatory domain-containing protein [Acidiferrimicrobium sp. IK]